VLDADGHATRAGAEVRLFAAGTRRLLGLRLVDSGSGYNAQNDMPVHFGLAVAGTAAPPRVDIEASFAAAGRRQTAVLRNVDPRDRRNRAVTMRLR
jgi:hypothetical protein